MRLLRDSESYLEINHRESPGFTCDEAVGIGLRRIAKDVGKGQVARVPVAQCVHCQRMVILNPNRTRDREICPRYHKYVCDWCKEARCRKGNCISFNDWIEQLRREAEVKEI